MVLPTVVLFDQSGIHKEPPGFLGKKPYFQIESRKLEVSKRTLPLHC